MSAPVLDAPPGLAAREGISAADLMRMQFAPIKWVVPGYICEGMTLLAGPPKTCKSWMVLGAAIAVGMGGTAFGSIRCEEGDVLCLMLEDNQRRVQDRLRQFGFPEMPERVTFLTRWPNLDDGCDREIEAWIRSVPNPRLVVVDVFARVRGDTGRRENEYNADYRNAALLQSLAVKHGIALICVHHTRKLGSDDDPFDAVSGTRGLTGAADSVLVLKRKGSGQYPILYGRGRDLPEFETAMEFEESTGHWQIVGNAAEIAKTTERQEILEVLNRSPDPMTPKEVADAIGKKQSNVSHRLAGLVDEGKVWKVPKGRYTPVTRVTDSLNSDSSYQSDRDSLGNPALLGVASEAAK